MSILNNINKPAPKVYRKFTNAYIVAFVPALIGAVQGWGLSDKTANRATIIIALSTAIVKGIGMIIANGEEYAKTESNGQQ